MKAKNRLNRPFAAYVRTQSALVIVVLIAARIVLDMIHTHTTMEISHMQVAFVLVVLTQLPTAIYYAMNETRALTSREGWNLGFTFVALTLVVELALLTIGGQAWPYIDHVYQLATTGRVDVLLTAANIVFLMAIFAALMFKTLFWLAVRNNLRDPGFDNLKVAPRTRAARALGVAIMRPQSLRRRQNHMGVFRNGLILANLSGCLLAITVFGMPVLQAVFLTLPLSIYFATICVANSIARWESKTSLSRKCFQISWRLFPLTLSCMLLFAICIDASVQGNTFEPSPALIALYERMQEGSINPVTAVGVVLGFIALILISNAATLLFFAGLIRPLAARPQRSARPAHDQQQIDSAHTGHAPARSGQAADQACARRPQHLVEAAHRKHQRSERPKAAAAGAMAALTGIQQVNIAPYVPMPFPQE